MQSISDGLAADVLKKTELHKGFEGIDPAWIALILMMIFDRINGEDMKADAQEILQNANFPLEYNPYNK